MPGLGVLLAVPFGLGGATGARTSLALLLVPVLGMAVYRWSRRRLGPADAALVTLGALACSPVVFGASQIYPDLAGGAAVFALVAWLWGGERRTASGWCAYWLVAGFLCWLHVKYYAPSAVLAAFGAWQLRRHPGRFRPATHALFGALFLTGPALFAAFSIPAFGDMLGGRGGGELNTDLLRAFELALGLHVDQVHGLFVQQPLLLAGPVALGWMIRRRHPLTIPWLVLYASLIVPNAQQRIEYGGAAAPAGRFGWSAMWLWLVPLGVAARGTLGGAGLAPVARLAVVAGVAYQTVLAASWFPAPQRLFNGLYAADRWQPSLFAPGMMLSLPKLGSHADIGYLPNAVWTLSLAALLAAGLLHRSKLCYLPLAAAAALGLLLLPMEDPLERSRTFPRRYEAEHLPFHCAVHASTGASNGQVCRQTTDRRFAVAGPFISLDPGAYEVVAAVAGPGGAAATGVLRVVSDRGRTPFARRAFPVPSSGRMLLVALAFDIDRTLQDVEFQVRGPRGLDVDYLELRPGPCLGESPAVHVRLQAGNGRFVSVPASDRGVLRAGGDVSGSRERFRLTGDFGPCLASGEEVLLQAWDGSYLRAARGGSIGEATGTAAGSPEPFLLQRRLGAGPVRSGDLVTLQAAGGHAVVAEPGGGGLRVDGARPGNGEPFRITVVRGL